MIEQKCYQSSTHGPIPLSQQGRILLGAERSAELAAIRCGNFCHDEMRLSRVRGELAKYMSGLEQQINTLTDGTRYGVDIRALRDQIHDLETQLCAATKEKREQYKRGYAEGLSRTGCQVRTYFTGDPEVTVGLREKDETIVKLQKELADARNQLKVQYDYGYDHGYTEAKAVKAAERIHDGGAVLPVSVPEVPRTWHYARWVANAAIVVSIIALVRSFL